MENLELQKKNWDLVLDGVQYSILKKPKLNGSNVPSTKKSRAC